MSRKTSRSSTGAKTLVHETAHIELRHIESVDECRAHRARMEVKAESVAYVVRGPSGFHTSTYSTGCMTGWADEDTGIIRETAADVLKAVNTIAGPSTTTTAIDNDY